MPVNAPGGRVSSTSSATKGSRCRRSATNRAWNTTPRAWYAWCATTTTAATSPPARQWSATEWISMHRVPQSSRCAPRPYACFWWNTGPNAKLHVNSYVLISSTSHT
ncbi:MAG: hypothetical protein MZV63_62825 [Marinilabiliales bacterium]|nr:hypothetical protein [Marinilabiliales bacterium]